MKFLLILALAVTASLASIEKQNADYGYGAPTYGYGYRTIAHPYPTYKYGYQLSRHYHKRSADTGSHSYIASERGNPHNHDHAFECYPLGDDAYDHHLTRRSADAEPDLAPHGHGFGHKLSYGYGHSHGLDFGHSHGLDFGHSHGLDFGHSHGLDFGHGHGFGHSHGYGHTHGYGYSNPTSFIHQNLGYGYGYRSHDHYRPYH